ncbi:hypothetical protein SGLAM104S_01926 [Streptomyces glaucescens]
MRECGGPVGEQGERSGVQAEVAAYGVQGLPGRLLLGGAGPQHGQRGIAAGQPREQAHGGDDGGQADEPGQSGGARQPLCGTLHLT